MKADGKDLVPSLDASNVAYQSLFQKQLKDVKAENVGHPSLGDFNSDGYLDIVVPVLESDEAESVTLFIWSFTTKRWQQKQVKLKQTDGDESVWTIFRRKGEKMFLRVGDYNLDGYPDLVTILESRKDKSRQVSIVPAIVWL